MDDQLLKYICCPICKSCLMVEDSGLVCTGCGHFYEIRNGVPVLIDLDNLDVHLKRKFPLRETT